MTPHTPPESALESALINNFQTSVRMAARADAPPSPIPEYGSYLAKPAVRPVRKSPFKKNFPLRGRGSPYPPCRDGKVRLLRWVRPPSRPPG